MALSFSRARQPFVPGDRRISITDVTCDGATYSAGGLTFTAANLGFDNAVDVILSVSIGKATGTNNFFATVNPNTGKVQIWKDDESGSDSPFLEVSNTDLSSAYKLRVVALGY